MNKKLKALILTVTMALSITTVWAVGNDMFLNIEKFQDMALKNTRQSKIDELQIESKKNALEEAEKDAKFLSPSTTRNQKYDNEIQKKVDPFKAKADLEYIKREKDINEENLKREVYETALDILIQEKEVELETEKLKILEEKLKMIKTRYDEGKITDNDLYNAEFAVSSKTIDLNKAQKNLEILKLELKRLLNVELDDSPIKVEDQLVFEPMMDIDMDVDMVVLKNVDGVLNIDTIIEKSIEKSLEYYKANKDLEAQEMVMEITKDIYEENHPTYKDNVLALEIAQLNLENIKTSIQVQVRNKYNDLKTAEENVNLAIQWEEIQKKKLEAEELKFEKGMISREQLLNAKEAYIESNYDKFAAIYNHNIIKSEFEALYK
ncbi:MAG: TolC family protein [Clostridium sp.]|nr:TolC family protein [Clostridium sp.]